MYDQPNDPWFKQKYIDVPTIFNDWISPHLDLRQAVVFDFGCGDGVMSLGIAKHLKPRAVVGIDSQYLYRKLGAAAKIQAGLDGLPDNLSFKTIKAGQSLANGRKAACIFSWSVFEHVDKRMLKAVVLDLRDALDTGGYLFIQVQPLYFSPFGSHLHGLVDKPWAHLLDQDNHLFDQVMSARRRVTDPQDMDFSDDYDFLAYRQLVWRCYQSLNKMTGDELAALLSASGFHTVREYRTQCEQIPPPELTFIYNESVLKNDQIVLLVQKT